MSSRTAVARAPTDPTGYVGALKYLEVMLQGKHRVGTGLWADADDLMTMVFDAAFVSGRPFVDSHGQLAHYAQSFELFDKQDPDRRSQLLERVETIPHLADFHVDIDMDGDLEGSRQQAERLVKHYLSLGVPEPAVGIRFSGKKGFDIALPWQVLGVRPQGVMSLAWTTWKLLGRQLIAELDLRGVDEGLWRRNGTIRLENTQHPSSSLFKVRLTVDELAQLETVLERAKQPRPSPYRPEAVAASLVVVPGLRRLYLPLQAQADSDLARIRALRARPLEPEVMSQVQGKRVKCVHNILRSRPQAGARNETVFHLAMMLKQTGHDERTARDLARGWLGSQHMDVGSDQTVNSVYTGPYAGGCRWMRDAQWVTPDECAACPIGQRRFVRNPRAIKTPETPAPAPTDAVALPMVDSGEPQLPTLARQREILREDFDHLNPNAITVIRTAAGAGKSYQALRKTVEMVKDGKRVLWFVKDTRKVGGLADDLRNELREVHDYHGKLQTLYGRDENNCDNWGVASEVEKKGYSVTNVVCNTCFARDTCGYFKQYDASYEPGVYIAPHAMLPILFVNENRGFAAEYKVHVDSETHQRKRIGAPLSMIVVDEDALDVLVERFWIGSFHLEQELRNRRRTKVVFDKLSGRDLEQNVDLDRNWLQVVDWLRSAIKVAGPVMPALASVARADGRDIGKTIAAINPGRIIDPRYDKERKSGQRPFTERLYVALTQEVNRLVDGNYTIWSTGGGTGMEVLTIADLQFPAGIPVVVLDAYANRDLYERYYLAAGVNRPLVFADYPVREQANVTYVLGANLLASEVTRLDARARNKIERIMTALQELTADGQETYLVAKRSFFDSQVWKEWEPRLPHCKAEGEAGQLYFWRGRGINAASGKRIAVLQVPNFHPDSVLAEASVLYANEPRLDDQRVRTRDRMAWAPGIRPPTDYEVDRMVYADERLNLINERYRMDELVQMALRGRSLTTGAEIIVFADLPDARLPAVRAFTLEELAAKGVAKAARTTVYEVLERAGKLTVENVAVLGLIEGGAGKAPDLRALVKSNAPEAFAKAKAKPVTAKEVEHELQEFRRGADA